jgi:hypothetical protein
MKKTLQTRDVLPSSGEMEERDDEISLASEELVGSIRPLIELAKARVAQSVNSELVMLYWQIGKTIQDKISAGRIAGQETGIVDLLSKTLTMEYGRGFSRRNLFHMIRLADTFEDERIVQTLSAQLSWSHFIEIIYQKDPLQRQFYAEMARVERWSVRTLRKKIQGMLYERTAISRKPEELARQELEALSEEDRMTPDLVFRDPYSGLGACRHLVALCAAHHLARRFKQRSGNRCQSRLKSRRIFPGFSYN